MTTQTSNTMGAVRLISLEAVSDESGKPPSRSLARSIASFLEQHVLPPFEYRQFSHTSFAIRGRVPAIRLEGYIVDLQTRLREFLFGESAENEAEAICYAGDENEVAGFLAETDSDAQTRSASFTSQVETRLAPSTGASSATPENKLEDRALLYRGILETHHSALFAYSLTPRSLKKYISDTLMAPFLNALGEHCTEFEIRAFETASDELKKAAKLSRPVIFKIPLSYRTLLSSAARSRYFAALRAQPVWVRDQMFLSVVGAPDTPHSGAVLRFVTEFRPWFRFLDWQTTKPDLMPETFAGSQLHSITLDLSLIEKDREQAIMKFRKVTAPLKSMKIRTGINDLRTPYELIQAITCDVRYASGNAITAALTDYCPAQKVQTSRLPFTPASAPPQREESFRNTG